MAGHLLLRAALLLVLIAGLVAQARPSRALAGNGSEENHAEVRSDSQTGQTNGASYPTFAMPAEEWRAAGERRFEIVRVSADGQIRLRPTSPKARRNVRIAEGRYLAFAFAADSKESPVAVASATVEKIETNGRVVLRVSESAAKELKQAETLALIRPPSATTSELESAPEIAAVRYVGVLEGLPASERQAAITKARLSQVVKALHAYHDIFDHFPPACVYGPDGKPWHSWRILLTPFFGDSGVELYNTYRLEEPWDGPNNRKLLDRIPEALQFPDSKSHFTPFVIAVGRQTAFPGCSNWNGDTTDLTALYGTDATTASLDEITDGWSNSILVGTVSADAQIPWTKPVDLEFNADFAILGEKRSFAAPFGTDGERYSLVGLADGAVVGLPQSLAKDDLHALLTVSGGEFPKPLPRIEIPAKQFDSVELRFTVREGSVAAQMREVP